MAEELPVNGTIDTRIGKLSFENGYPTRNSVERLYDEMDFQRACQAYIWGIPAVGLHEWAKAHANNMKGKNGEMDKSWALTDLEEVK